MARPAAHASSRASHPETRGRRIALVASAAALLAALASPRSRAGGDATGAGPPSGSGTSACLAAGAAAPSAAAAPSVAPPPAAGSSAAAPGPDAPDRWCARELEQLGSAACVSAPARLREPLTLVLFLHGVVKPETTWQWAQQRALARAAAVHGFVALMPRGRRGYGPRGMEDWWTWPTSARGQQAIEAELVAEWQRDRAELEQRLGHGFARALVFGFSNGAYYAASLALRGRVPADGFGVFAGGSSGEHLLAAARRLAVRPPIYVGYGTADRSAREDAVALGRALRRLGWPSRVVARPGVGHTMTDAMLAEALAFGAGE